MVTGLSSAAPPEVAPDSFEPDNSPDQAPFLAGFDLLPSNDLIVEHDKTLHRSDDVDWTSFATTFNYPTSWIGGPPNTNLFVQICQDLCDDISFTTLNLQIFNFDLIENPATASPVFELNPCTAGFTNETETQLPNFTSDEALFVRVVDCNGGDNISYRLILRRSAVGVNLHTVSGSVTILNDSGQPAPAPAFAVIRSNYNDFTFANPADGTYILGLLAEEIIPGRGVTDLELTVTLFNAPFEATQTKLVTNMVPEGSQVINFQLNLFRNGFEEP